MRDGTAAPTVPATVQVVVGAAPPDALGATLDSLAAQTASGARFEVLVVEATGATDAAAERFRAARPDVALRRLTLPAGSIAAARTAALHAARGEHATFVDAGSTVSTRYVEALLAAGSASTIAAAHVVDTDDGVPDLRPGSHAARTFTGSGPLGSGPPGPIALGAVLGRVEGTLFPTAPARTVGFAEPAPGDGGALFHARLVAHAGLAVAVCAAADNAVLYAPRPPEPRPADHLDVLAGLAAVDSGPAVDPVLAGLAGEESAALNRLLHTAADPAGAHEELLAEIRHRGLGTVDHARLNAGLARDLAILYVALPFADTSANIAARRIREAGTLVDVVCADLGRYRSVDPSAELIWREYVDAVHRVPGPATVESDWGPIAAFCRAGERLIAGAERVKGPYRSVYSRTMFPAAHLLAALHKLRHPDVPWLAEFSDPQLHGSAGTERTGRGDPDPELLAVLRDGMRAHGMTPPAGDNVWEWAENLAYALADTVLFTNDQQRDYMLGYCADPALVARASARAVVREHPQPRPELYNARPAAYDLEPGRVHLGYFGTFYATRSLTEVVDALRSLSPAHRDRIRLHVFTRSPDRLAAQVQQLGLGDVLVAHPYVAFLDYLDLATRLDVLLVNDYRTRGTHAVNPYLPAKYADYVGSGTDVWGIVEPGSVLSRRPLAHRSQLGDVDGARRVLETLATRAEAAQSPTGRP